MLIITPFFGHWFTYVVPFINSLSVRVPIIKPIWCPCNINLQPEITAPDPEIHDPPPPFLLAFSSTGTHWFTFCSSNFLCLPTLLGIMSNNLLWIIKTALSCLLVTPNNSEFAFFLHGTESKAQLERHWKIWKNFGLVNRGKVFFTALTWIRIQPSSTIEPIFCLYPLWNQLSTILSKGFYFPLEPLSQNI